MRQCISQDPSTFIPLFGRECRKEGEREPRKNKAMLTGNPGTISLWWKEEERDEATHYIIPQHSFPSPLLFLTRIGTKDGEVDVVGEEPSTVLQEAAQVRCAGGARQKRREDGGKDTTHPFFPWRRLLLLLLLLLRVVVMVGVRLVWLRLLSSGSVAAGAAAARRVMM